MDINKLVYSYYILSQGIEPEEADFNSTLATVKYLKDNNYDDNQIMKILEGIGKEKITGDDLPKELWDNSLLEKGVFYYSDIFHIKSKPPSWDPITYTEICEDFFLEMKINFTMNDLLSFYYDKCRVPNGLQNDKKDAGAFNHLIKKYEVFSTVPGIDYVIALINKAGSDIDKNFVSNVFEIEEYNKEVIEHFQKVSEESSFDKNNVIAWRK